MSHFAARSVSRLNSSREYRKNGIPRSLAAAAILVFLVSWDEFGYALLLQVTNRSLPPMLYYLAAFGHPGLASAVAAIMLGLDALGLAALFSAEVSTADAVLFMLTTSIGKDLYKGLLRPGASDKQLLRFTRWCAVACGAAGAVCALLLDDQDDMVVKAMSWALRSAIEHDRAAVESFLAAHEGRLAARVKREVRNKLATGLKNP